MAKSKLRQEQEAPMDVYAHRLTAKHARVLREIGKGNESEGVRELVERYLATFVERRKGPADRRTKKR